MKSYTNKIEAIKSTSEYSTSEHLIITIDGWPLDHFISDFDPTGRLGYKGLVPTLLTWLENEAERKVV